MLLENRNGDLMFRGRAEKISEADKFSSSMVGLKASARMQEIKRVTIGAAASPSNESSQRRRRLAPLGEVVDEKDISTLVQHVNLMDRCVLLLGGMRQKTARVNKVRDKRKRPTVRNSPETSSYGSGGYAPVVRNENVRARTLMPIAIEHEQVAMDKWT
ncbi:unnamed protein product [marine sediment metagenome]|uniref:Uncharacterized protein n=1 Tax=marine sediment metagenome TaxID=412755 RepID=X1QJ16_9ZZZZ